MVIPIDSPVKSKGGCFGLGEIDKIKSPACETRIIEVNVTIKPANQIRRVRNIFEAAEFDIIGVPYFSLRYPPRVSLLYPKHLILTSDMFGICPLLIRIHLCSLAYSLTLFFLLQYPDIVKTRMLRNANTICHGG